MNAISLDLFVCVFPSTCNVIEGRRSEVGVRAIYFISINFNFICAIVAKIILSFCFWGSELSLINGSVISIFKIDFSGISPGLFRRINEYRWEK